MKHPGEEVLVLYLYGEVDDPEPIRQHVKECEECRRELELLRKVVAEVDGMVLPELPVDYGRRVWEKLARELPRSRRFRPLPLGFLAAAAALLLLATFLAGRYTAPGSDAGSPSAAAIRERVLLVALSDHLDRSQVLLLELVNQGEARAVPLDRDRAGELLQASRLYRQTAHSLGDAATADVLEELEKILLDVSQGPDSAEAVDALRDRIQERDMLFKLRVLNSTVKKF